MTANKFRSLALSLPEAIESAHMGHPDFRVGGKIFATLGPDEDWGMVKLTTDVAQYSAEATGSRINDGSARFMYEHRTRKLLDRSAFTKRVLRHLAIATAIAAVSLTIGVAGYHYLAELSWLDALLNASMILGGMGPVDPLRSPAAKLFASFYALFSGLVIIGVASVLVAPFAHRLLHHFHIDEK